MDIYHNCWYILSYVCQHVYFVFDNLNNSVITAIQLPTTNPCGGSLSVVLSKEKLGMLQSKVVPSLLSILNVPLKRKKNSCYNYIIKLSIMIHLSLTQN